MTDETLERLRKIEEESSGDVHLLEGVLDVDDKHKTLGVIEKAQKLEHEERKLRLEESRQKLETEKFEYQKKQTKKDNRVKILVASLTGGGAILAAFAKGIQVILQRKYVKENYNIEQVTSIASPTARMLGKDGANPRI